MLPVGTAVAVISVCVIIPNPMQRSSSRVMNAFVVETLHEVLRKMDNYKSLKIVVLGLG